MLASFGPAEFFFAMLLVGGAISVFRSIQQSQERRHLERMKALELGRPVPVGRLGATLVCLATGGLVPAAALGMGMAVLDSHPPDDVAIPAIVLSLLVGLGGVISSTILALRLLPHRAGTSAHLKPSKPEFDPDAYDLDPVDVARR